MTRYQVTDWRELPSLATAWDCDQVASSQLADRFQGTIDEGAR